MDGENDGKPYFLMDDLGVQIIFGNTQIDSDFNFHLLLILVMTWLFQGARCATHGFVARH